MFQNEPLTSFSSESERTLFEASLNEIQSKIDSDELVSMPIVGGKEIRTDHSVTREDPSKKSQMIGKIYYADQDLALKAIQTLKDYGSEWEDRTFEERASILEKIAAGIKAKRFLLAALMVREVGKNWKEADADVAEAIDFCRYYAQEIRRLWPVKKTMELMGEDNFYFYQSRGIAAVIAPWNFPLAIACGMTTAALVTGNKVILKPSEQTSIIGYHLAKIILDSGVPNEAFAFLPGIGEVVGRALVSSPMTDLICFTGSKPVGLEIINTAAKVVPGQRNVKRVVAEMGGKNAIIVDSDADQEDAIKGILHSAFGFSGQKCSACSRLIVVGAIYDEFLRTLAEAAGDLKVGTAQNPGTIIGPVIDAESRDRILKAIERGDKENKLLFKGSAPDGGHFVPPTIFKDVSNDSFLWREELFGPVIACTRANSFQHAIELANDSEYALTGGVYSRSPNNIEIAKREFRVGNLYINRACTGAYVCRQPFGGSAMSGVGSKAGGPDYLIQFMEPRTITENVARKGMV